MDEQNIKKRSSSIVTYSATVKILTIGLLILILLIPASMIKRLIRERESRRDGVVEEISYKWGMEQTIAGPIITIPYKKYFKDEKGNTTSIIEYMHFLPKEINIKGILYPEIRYRGIYETVLYNAKLNIEGTFSNPNYKDLNVRTNNILWSRSFISIGISDMKGIKEKIVGSVNGQNISMNPGIDINDILGPGVNSKIIIHQNGGNISFKFDLDLNGSDKINFIPVGEITNVSISSSWPSPSFSGAFLPVNRVIDKNGFNADWKILHLNRNYPQYWIGDKYNIHDSDYGDFDSGDSAFDNSAFGVKLFIAADIYQKTMRTAKYAIMFIAFTFTAFFFSEIMNKKRLHPIQYLLIGFAIIIFYTLLISISEHINFDIAYLISSISAILLITGYSKGILNSNKLSLTVFGILSILYTYLYIVLQLEDYALLVGSIGLFVVLSCIMYITRKIDWYSVKFDNGQLET